MCDKLRMDIDDITSGKLSRLLNACAHTESVPVAGDEDLLDALSHVKDLQSPRAELVASREFVESFPVSSGTCASIYGIPVKIDEELPPGAAILKITDDHGEVGEIRFKC